MSTTTTPEAALFAKIAKAQAEMGGLTTDKRANIRTEKANYSYEYISDSAMMAAVRRILSPLSVAVFVSVIDERKDGNLSVVRIRVTFADGESGATFSIDGVGYGTDTSDKGAGKAQTSAIRYALTKTFLQGGDADPEQDSQEHTPAPRQQRSPAAAPARNGGVGPEARQMLEDIVHGELSKSSDDERLRLMEITGLAQLRLTPVVDWMLEHNHNSITSILAAASAQGQIVAPPERQRRGRLTPNGVAS